MNSECRSILKTAWWRKESRVTLKNVKNYQETGIFIMWGGATSKGGGEGGQRMQCAGAIYLSKKPEGAESKKRKTMDRQQLIANSFWRGAPFLESPNWWTSRWHTFGETKSDIKHRPARWHAGGGNSGGFLGAIRLA